jgi:hypothetical protein
MRTFGKRTTPPVENGRSSLAIPVKESAYGAGDAELVQDVVNFVNFAVREARLGRTEVAPNALRSYHVDFYTAQVNNGGHGQYAHNSRMDPLILGDCQHGLLGMGHGAAALHDQMMDLARMDPARMAAVAQAAGFGKPDPLIAEIDAEFYRLERTTPLVAANAGWLRSLTELQVVPDADYPSVLRKLAQRGATTPQRAEPPEPHGFGKDPMTVALNYLAMMVPKPFTGLTLVKGMPGYDLGDGVQLIRFVAECNGERYSAFFHPEACLLFTEQQPPLEIAKVPTEMVVSFVREMTGQDLMKLVAAPMRTH